MPTAPLTLTELAGRLAAVGGFEMQPRIAVAVSGGPDSMALVLLADRWVRQRGGAVTALIVDHGLRPESAAEAETVAGWLADRGIRRHILRWDGAKPRRGIQEAAREARYSLLAEWCRRHSVLHLLTAHHREDQVETHLIRRRAGSGPDGLAAMPAVRELSGCRLVRPLLAVPKARLAALLAAERQPFLRDPTNDNPAFERARVRNSLDEGTIARVEAELRHCGHQRIDREADLERLMATAVSLHPAGFALLDPGPLAGCEPELVERLLGRVAASIGGARYPLRRARLARLRSRLAAQPERALTLGGCQFVPWRGRLLVLRELAAAAPPVRLEPGDSLLWDRRFSATLPSRAGGGAMFGYLGQSGLAIPQAHGSLAPRLIHPVLPALWDGAGLLAVPHLDYRRAGLAATPSLSLRPANPLTRAGFTVV